MLIDLVRLNFRHPPFLWFAVAASLCTFGVLAIDCIIVLTHLGIAYDDGWRAERRGTQYYVAAVKPGGPAMGRLQLGDRVLTIIGDPRLEHIDPEFRAWFLPLDRPYMVRVERSNTALDVRVSFTRVSSGRSVLDLLAYTAVSLSFLVMGTIMAIAKPNESVTRVGFLAGVTIALQMLFADLTAVSTGLRGWELTFAHFSTATFQPLHFCVAYDFLSRFPSGTKPSGLWSYFRRIFYLYGVIAWSLYTTARALFNSNLALDANHKYSALFELAFSPSVISTALGSLILIAMIAVLIRNFMVVADPDQRRRLKWTLIGMVTGLTPLALSFAFLGFSAAVTNKLFDAANFCVIAAPLTLTYAFAKHRVLGVSVVVRRGLQYLLARNALRVILLIPVAMIAFRVLMNPDRPVRDVLFQHSSPFYAFLVVTLALLHYRKQVSLWLDRKFFREAYDQERILRELLESVKQMDEIPAIARLVTREIETALHPTRVMMFYRKSGAGNLTLGHSSGGASNEHQIADGRPLMRALKGRATPLDLSRHGGDLPAEEREWTSRLGIAVAVPIANAGHLDGVLLLGEKKSEEPYTRTDRNLLQAIAGQVAVVHENLSLRERVAREQRVRTEVLARLDDRQILLLKECPVCGACFDSSLERCAHDGAELFLTLPIERTLEGKYRLDRLLGKGGMGAVYAATDIGLNRTVAVKVMMGRFFGNQNALRRFEREAQASARLSHPNITSIHDYGRIGDSGAFLVMELLAGRTLRQELKSRGRLDAVTAADWFQQLFEGVEAAHRAGVVHRDLKPENVLVTTSSTGADQIKILDFGLAKVGAGDVAGTSATSLTVAGVALGTFGYMSPEQFTGGAVDERADIFALGVMVAEVLTGERPFKGATYNELAHAIFHEDYHLPSDSNEVRALDDALQRCLAREQSQRYATVAEMRDAVIPAMRHFPTQASPPAASEVSTITITGEPEPFA
jgi:hypothetical protein